MGAVGWPGPIPISELGRHRQHVDELAALAAAELHRARRHGEQRVIAAPAHVLTGMEAGAPLAHDDGAGLHQRAVVDLDAEALSGGITPVPGGAPTFGLRHIWSASRYARDLDGRVLLAVAPLAPAAGLVLVGVARDLGTLGLAHDPGRDGRPAEVARLGQHGVA